MTRTEKLEKDKDRRGRCGRSEVRKKGSEGEDKTVYSSESNRRSDDLLRT